MNLKTSILLETTEDGQWAAFISHGPLSTGRVFPDLKTACYEARARVKEFQMADKFASKLDGMPEFLDLADQEKTSTALGKETYVIGPGFGVQERSTEPAPAPVWNTDTGVPDPKEPLCQPEGKPAWGPGSNTLASGEDLLNNKTENTQHE